MIERHITGRIEVKDTGLINFYDEKGCYIEQLTTFMKEVAEDLGYYVDFDKPTEPIKIENVLVSLYISKKARTYEEMVETHISNILGLEYAFDWVGYSEFTILDIWVDTLTVGGHNLLKILKEYDGHFVTLAIKTTEE